jgi:hypothetical protein
MRSPFDQIAAAHANYVEQLADKEKTPPQSELERLAATSFEQAVSRTIAGRVVSGASSSKTGVVQVTERNSNATERDRADLVGSSSKTGLVGDEGLEPPTPSV